MKAVFLIFVLLYLSGYYTVSSTEIDKNGQDEPIIPELVRAVATPTKRYLLQPVGEKNSNKLPGAITDNSKKFEGEEEVKPKRDVNMLPGAIGLEGAFDEDKVSMFPDPNSTEDKEKGKSPDAEGKANKTGGGGSESDGDSEGKKQKEKKRKKTKKKKKMDSEQAASTKNTGRSGNEMTKEEKQTKAEHESPTLKAKESNENSSSGESVLKQNMLETAEKEKEETKFKEKSSTKEKSMVAQSPGPLFDGPVPMNRQMEELQVPGEKELNDETVRTYYEKLVKAFLAPFAGGISRDSFFEILKRRTYSMAPPGSNKGVQTLLFQLQDKKLYMLDPYDIAKNSKPFYKTRIQELIWLLSDIAKGGVVPDTEFLVAIHDCVQTVNQDHEYRGSIYKESSPTFTIVSCNFSDNIPFPMWEGDPVRGGLKSWDEKMDRYRAMDTTPWEKKEAKAVFRGGNRPSMYFKTKREANDFCDHSGRTAIAFLAENHPDLFNVGVSGNCGGKSYSMQHLSESGHHAFKYIMYAEGNCFWADRLNKQIFGPSVIIKQETPCGQFWEPLLKPMTHYIPTDFFFSDTVQKIQWAKENDDKAAEMVKKANEFASAFLSVKGIKTYVEVLLVEYTRLLKQQTITPEKGSKDVTV